MTFTAQNFRSVGIRGQGSLFNIIDTTPGTGGLVFSVLTGIKKITVSPGYTLAVANLELGNLSSLTIGALRLDGDGTIYLNDDVYLHTETAGVTSTATNTGIGVRTLSNVENGAGRNTAVGYQSMQVNTTGSQNTALGYSSLVANTTGIQNTSIGQQSMLSNTIGNNNVSIGNGSLIINTTGNHNTALGDNAGSGTITGNNNTLIGSIAGSSLPAAQNHCILLNNLGATVAQDGEVHIGNQTDQSLTYVHTPFVTDKGTSSTGPAAIPVTSSYHEITSTGADTVTLADGVNGQHIFIVFVVDGGTVNLIRASSPGGASITFTNVGNSVHLLYLDNGGWYIVGASANIAFP